ncbi:DNA polymerase III subunit epsilon [Aliarcobacter trophiarum LMG 25534]|uniref:DNA polymerase III subunit epsilon n=1 Tax=Aliarcobacter trophiarum LMG 25534 TaxID=1032241 RepID=A0AAD0VMW4_9BACT|nr:3'-5' exonuclease [Aliarcobacter trophiarum]AXK49335.1 DNA polymerase III, epsilon subunit [Aliarcobacter trophiarum LMG 25534]RXJ90099.1 DNA polymerase III subunit epsilon [Aliarcobacter trophiarum LMG 25534]
MFKNILKQWQKKKLFDKKFDFLFNESTKDEWVSLDCETTGLNPKKDEILSIGAVIIKENKILMRKTFNIFVKPSKNINPESIKIHHLREIDLQNAVEPDEAIYKLLEFIGSRPIVGYYIDFDMEMISKYTKKLIGIKLPNRRVEVSSIYYDIKKTRENYGFIDLKFDTIMNNLNIPTLGKHDALNDAIMTSMIFLKLKNLSKEKKNHF